MNGKTSVGVTTTEVRPADNLRRRFMAVNDSTSTIYLCQGVAVLNTGIPLTPGGSFVDEIDIHGYIYRGAYSAISAVAAQNLSWIEEYI